MYDIKKTSDDEIRKARFSHSKYPFNKMEIDDSFEGDFKAANCAKAYGHYHNLKFSRTKIGIGKYIIRRVK